MSLATGFAAHNARATLGTGQHLSTMPSRLPRAPIIVDFEPADFCPLKNMWAWCLAQGVLSAAKGDRRDRDWLVSPSMHIGSFMWIAREALDLRDPQKIRDALQDPAVVAELRRHHQRKSNKRSTWLKLKMRRSRKALRRSTKRRHRV